jgi:hypothetical protein
MILPSTIDREINRLQGYFGAKVVARPPASAAELAELEAAAGVLPRELKILLATCNGLRVAAGNEAGYALWHTHQMLEAVHGRSVTGLPDGLLPLYGEPPGELDCLVVADGPCQNAVVRWDPSAPGARLIASSPGAYFARWVTALTEQFDPRGTPKRSTPPGRLTIRRSDDEPDFARMQADRRVHAWLHSLDLTVACGDDFE